MATAAPAPAYPRFSFGKTISDTFSVLGGNFGQLALLCFLFGALPGMLFNYVYYSAMFSSGSSSYFGDPSQMFERFMGVTFVGLFISWVGYCLLEACVVRLSLRHLGGRKGSLGDTLGYGFGKLVPVMAVSFLSWLVIIAMTTVIVVLFSLLFTGAIYGASSGADAIGAVLIFFLLLPIMMIPIIFFCIAWLVQVPVAVAEGGIISTFARSWQLTRGARLKIFALCLLFIIGMWIVQMVLAAIGMMTLGNAIYSSDFEAGDFPPFLMMLPLLIVMSLLSMLSLMIAIPGLAAIYSNLRESKEGVNQDRIADVFG